VKKCSRRRKLVRVSHVMRLGTQADLTVALQGMGLSGRLNTACIERVNLTVRHGVAALARRTWATSQQAPQLLAHLEWWRAYSHFVRPHASLRVALMQPRERGGKRLAQRYRPRTPAMAVGRTNRRWTAREVLSYPLPLVPAWEPPKWEVVGSAMSRGDGWRCQQKNSDEASPREEKACPHCLMTKNRPEMGLERADRIIHHVQWQHPHHRCGKTGSLSSLVPQTRLVYFLRHDSYDLRRSQLDRKRGSM